MSLFSEAGKKELMFDRHFEQVTRADHRLMPYWDRTANSAKILIDEHGKTFEEVKALLLQSNLDQIRTRSSTDQPSAESYERATQLRFDHVVRLLTKHQNSTMNNNPAVQVRLDMIDGMFDLRAETTDYMKSVRKSVSDVARSVVEGAPEDVDVGRIIAALDALQQVKNVLCDAAIIGSEKTKRARTSTN